MLAKIRKLVQEKCDPEDWDNHISLVVKYSKIIAQELGSDVELAELGALLHDIGWIEDMKNDHDHEISGQPIAEKILKDFGYDQDTIDKVKHIIASHRSSAGIEPETITAKIVANADAMAHFDVIPWFIKLKLNKYDNNLKRATQWTYDKIERDWNKKLTMPEAKEIVKEKYEAIKTVLKPIINYPRSKDRSINDPYPVL
jgi:putative nucleotidyltransferase with HDIG domain